MKNGDHEILDQVIDELRNALHLQLDIVSPGNHEINLDAVEQAGHLIKIIMGQIQMVILPSRVSYQLNERHKQRAMEYQAIIQHYRLDELKPYISNWESKEDAT